jgi:hypothetical protein
MGEMRVEYKIVAGKREGKRSFVRLNHRREDIIGMDLREISVGKCGLGASC